MNNTISIIIQCILLVPTVATIGAFWYLVFAKIVDGTFVAKPTDNEIEEKTR